VKQPKTTTPQFNVGHNVVVLDARRRKANGSPMSQLTNDERHALEIKCVHYINAVLHPEGKPVPAEFDGFDLQEAQKTLATERQIALAREPAPAEPSEDYEFQSTAKGVQARANEYVARGITDLSAISRLMNVNRRHASVLVARGRKAKKLRKK
jgi:hypothetical protein